jgi:hypothetical protein
MSQIENEIRAARDPVERSKLLFIELRSTLGLARASQLWWAYFSAYDAAET